MRAAELTVEPEAEVVQRNLGGDARLQAGQGVRPLAIEAEGMEELVDDGFDDLARAGQPAPPDLRPRMRARALRRANHHGAVVLMPALMMGTPLEPLVDDVRTGGGRADTGAARIRVLAQGKEGVGERLILGAARRESKPGDRARGGDGQQQSQPLEPAQPIAPADLGGAGKPAGAAPRRLASRVGTAVLSSAS